MIIRPLSEDIAREKREKEKIEKDMFGGDYEDIVDDFCGPVRKLLPPKIHPKIVPDRSLFLSIKTHPLPQDKKRRQGVG